MPEPGIRLGCQCLAGLRPPGQVQRARKAPKCSLNSWGLLGANDVATARRCDRVIFQAGTVGGSHGTTILLLMRLSVGISDSDSDTLCGHSGRFDQLDNTSVSRQAALSSIGFWGCDNGRSNHAADECGPPGGTDLSRAKARNLIEAAMPLTDKWASRDGL